MKIAHIVGTRPEFIQVSPLIRAIKSYNKRQNKKNVISLLINTGQHYDYLMSEVFFKELNLPEPDYHLGVGSGTHAYQTGEILKRLENVLIKEKPQLVIVYGDTNSTLAGALSAVKLHLKVAHIEAGVRSYNRIMPEEINRVITDQICDIHFCPSRTAIKNLRHEGIVNGVFFVGDIMYDSIKFGLKKIKSETILKNLSIKPKEYAVATIHRAENTENAARLKSIVQALEHIASNVIAIVFPIHPRTKKKIQALDLNIKNLRIIEPVSYINMLCLQKNAKMIFTDSGGMQKESFYLKTPCITLREETEWIETVELGWNILGGWRKENILSALSKLNYLKRTNINVYGNGNTAEKILKIVVNEVD
ncbi:MAG: UDP-N-acetylglucosamine 2-epimerase (non-hydrolyzing) [candidate division WOR-3 bacterium]